MVFTLHACMLYINSIERTHSSGGHYGAAGTLIITGQSKAKRRVFAFLTVFLMTGVLSEFHLFFHPVAHVHMTLYI